MIIIENRKKIEASEYFTDFSAFLSYLKENYKKMNYDNSLIIEKMEVVFDKILYDDGNVYLLRIGRFLSKTLGFEYKNVLQLGFWLERGFSKEYYSDFIIEENKRRGVKLSERYKSERTSRRILKLSNDVDTKFRYKGNYFTSRVEPKCNLCLNSLIFLLKFNEGDGDYYDIECCSNVNCESKSSGTKLKQKAFLPNDLYESIRKNISEVAKKFSRFSTQYYIDKGFTEEEAIAKISKMQSGYALQNTNPFIPSKENLAKHGYTEDEIERICRTPAMTSFWVDKGFTEEEAIEKVSINNKYASSFVDYDNRLIPSNTQYWIERGHTEEEAKLKVSDSQRTFSKQICIDKHGEEKGLEIFNERNRKWQETLYKNGNIKGGYSKISQELFDNISDILYYDFKYATNGGEYAIRKNNRNYYYDFVDLENMKIIEYNGDQYHANPKLYEADDCPHPYHKNKEYCASIIWSKDASKKKLAEDNGFELIYIWDSEYKKDKDGKLKECINFLINNNNNNNLKIDKYE